MHILLLPFFIATLFVKNLLSWSKMFFEAVGFQLALIALIALNVFLGYSLYEKYRLHQLTAQRLSEVENSFAKQRSFWDNIVKEYPGHRQAQDIQKKLAE